MMYYYHAPTLSPCRHVIFRGSMVCIFRHCLERAKTGQARKYLFTKKVLQGHWKIVAPDVLNTTKAFVGCMTTSSVLVLLSVLTYVALSDSV